MTLETNSGPKTSCDGYSAHKDSFGVSNDFPCDRPPSFVVVFMSPYRREKIEINKFCSRHFAGFKRNAANIGLEFLSEKITEAKDSQ